MREDTSIVRIENRLDAMSEQYTQVAVTLSKVNERLEHMPRWEKIKKEIDTTINNQVVKCNYANTKKKIDWSSILKILAVGVALAGGATGVIHNL